MTTHNSSNIQLSKKGDRRNHFVIRRFKNSHGFHVYELENSAESRKIFIPRFIFGRFRACVRNIINQELPKSTTEPFEYATTFLNRDYFYFKSSRVDLDNLIIQDIEEREGSSGYLTVNRRSLNALDSLLYNEKLQHPSDVLDEIVSYHKLFQFSFVKGSKSITSDLALRKDVLQSIEKYNPRLAERTPIIHDENTPKSTSKPTTPAAAKKKKKADQNVYQPKLGERFHEKNIEVDYDQVFGDSNVSLIPSSDSEEKPDKNNSKNSKILSQFPTSLSAIQIKAFDKEKYSFELSSSESSKFRERFIGDRSSDFYLGFEIVDALFTHNKSVKTFRFPLYYMGVSIRESGREVHIQAKHDGKIYLNHLALAHLVEKFTDNVAGIDQVDKFFKTLLAQDISIDRLNDRIKLTRFLPINDLIFDRSREILFGYQDENGKGGILSDLKVNGIECDLQSVYLYRASKLQSPIEQALEQDLDKIHTIAHQSSKRFYSSLLGKFLTPELNKATQPSTDKQPLTWIPGSLPKSTRSLIQQLTNHDLLLLEGPPGTGKTHTIMNLLIHAIASKQRVLIVSDQQAAIEALVEKMLGYLIGNDKGTAIEGKWKELLFSAIKVVDQVETGEQTLPDLAKQLSKILATQDPGIGIQNDTKSIAKKLSKIQEKIAETTQHIHQNITHEMDIDVDFSDRIPRKDQQDINFQGLLSYLTLIFGENKKDNQLLSAFIENRLELIDKGFDDCYSFFKIPTKNIDNERQLLKEDAQLLESIISQTIETPDDLQRITAQHPRNEIIRYLESSLHTFTEKSKEGVKGIIQNIRKGFKSPLQNDSQLLHSHIIQQIALLDKFDEWSIDTWFVLRNIHESIRVGDMPSLELSLYLKANQQLAIQGKKKNRVSSSIHGLLEQIEDLYLQQDRLVKDGFVSCLKEIIQSATLTKRGSGTNNITSVMAQVDNLKQFNTITESGNVHEELKQTLSETFPIWLVRKQIVPFLLPCIEQSFDLVIVDEATQCKVDDALSLMFRAKKMLVVGDDKQTVLQKNSVVDDYLFNDHELDEHLRSTQARGFKGGGSHIFGLVKSIKQGSVMLDEHYRCPADIIEFSNKYVYENELKVMQWTLPEIPSTVVVDYSEKKIEPKKKPTSGKFKGIETAMIDRYLDYVSKTVKKIEKSTGKNIDVESDVALCYFLMKNEPYVKYVKDSFLRNFKQGEDILDGAGAALQGKERDYIFYLWDITRYNIGAFKQGDDADKRKGELNVLMSRPKKKAFHYLHHSFEQLDHSRTNITRYLWRSLLNEEDKKNVKRDNDARDESLMSHLLKFTVLNSNQRGLQDTRVNIQENSIDFRKNIVVGDARYVVDMIAYPSQRSEHVVGVVDLSAFGIEPDIGQNIVDYYFQLKRAIPKIVPVFAYPHELVNENGQTFRSLMEKFSQLDM